MRFPVLNGQIHFRFQVGSNISEKENSMQFLLGTTGGKNNWWRGWDFYLDDKNYVNLRLINIEISKI